MNTSIVRALNCVCFSKVFPFIIGSVAVDMIDLFWRLVSCHHFPNDTLDEKRWSLDTGGEITIGVDPANFVACMVTIPAFAGSEGVKTTDLSSPPLEDSGFGIIVDEFPQEFGGGQFSGGASGHCTVIIAP